MENKGIVIIAVVIIAALLAVGIYTSWDNTPPSGEGDFVIDIDVRPGEYLDINVGEDTRSASGRNNALYQWEITDGALPGIELINERYTINPPPFYLAFLRGNFTGTEDASITVSNHAGTITATYNLHLIEA